MNERTNTPVSPAAIMGAKVQRVGSTDLLAMKDAPDFLINGNTMQIWTLRTELHHLAAQASQAGSSIKTTLSNGDETSFL